MEITEAYQHREAGVTYSWLTYPTIEPVAKGMVARTFQWYHAPSDHKGERTIYLYPSPWIARDLLRLVDHWNAAWHRGGDWRYSV